MSARYKGSGYMPYATRIALLIAVALGCTECLFSQERLAFDVNSGVVHGSMMDIRDKRRVLLLTSKSYVVDSRGSARSVLNEIYQNPASARPRHSPAYNIIGRQLNKYIRKYQSLSAVEHLANADFVIAFKVVRDLRFSIESELFVI